jgi:glycosyltransferase involved in cell wall biosynthesis
MKSISIIIPALDEEKYIGDTLQWVEAATQTWMRGQSDATAEVIVVDNDSTDRTAELARSYDAIVVPEPERNISRARNAGAKVATGEVLLFLDADTRIPPTLFQRIASVMDDPECIAGVVAVQHLPARKILRLYLWCWRIFGRFAGMAQGAAQFYRRDTFQSLGGYDENMYMGEDVEFYWAAGRAARETNRRVHYLRDVQVVPSPRRYDAWPLWKTLLWTNPVMIVLLRRWQGAWRGWYKDVPR